MQTHSRDKTAGFSLIEIMIVLAIIGLIAAAVATNLMGVFTPARKDVARLQVREAAAAANRYLIQHGECPTIETLITEKVFRSTPRDPWKHPLLLRCPGLHDTSEAEVWSPGPDGVEGNGDDIVSWVQ